jgi:SAM-dependent methyltransferase
MGCGDGGFAAIANQYFHVEGIDTRPGPIHPCNSYPAPQIVKADIYDVDLEHAAYDVITVFNLLEHLREPHTVIQEAHSGLKPGGILFGSVPNNSFLVGRIHTLITNLWDRTHCSTFRPNKWLNHLKGSGFRSVWLFGELLLGRTAFYCMSPKTHKLVSFNLMFLCKKDEMNPALTPPPHQADPIDSIR